MSAPPFVAGVARTLAAWVGLELRPFDPVARKAS
jgi:hypothetical protein